MTAQLTTAVLGRTSWARQHLLARAEGTVAEMVGAAGGLQAQHPGMPSTALWARRAGTATTDLDDACWVDGRVVGTWALDVDGDRATLAVTSTATAPDLTAALRDELDAEGVRLVERLAPDAAERAVTWSRPAG